MTLASDAGAALADRVREALRVVDDPELGVDIVSLGLVYEVAVDVTGGARVVFSLTSMGCPIGPMIERDIVTAAERVDGIEAVETELVFDPPWSPERMADEVKFALGYLL
ncbi:MAG: metal-sulfur cluster assembly factor [Gaiellaceae bacterium]